MLTDTLISEASDLLRDYEAELEDTIRHLRFDEEKHSHRVRLARVTGVRERLGARRLARRHGSSPLPPVDSPDPCEDCGNDTEFVRYYVEEHKERLTPAGEWETVESYEYDDGAHTYSECAVCEGAVHESALLAPPMERGPALPNLGPLSIGEG